MVSCVDLRGALSLRGRARECAARDDILDRLWRRDRGAGEAGTSKIAPMNYGAGIATGCRVAHVAAFSSE